MKWKLRYIYSEPLDTETLLYKRDCCARVGGGGSPSSFEVLVYVDLFSLFLSFLSDTRIHRMIRQLCSKESCGVIDNGNTTTAPILAYLLLYLRGRCVWERRSALEDGVLKECAVPTNLFQMLISLLLSFFLSPCLYSFFVSFCSSPSNLHWRWHQIWHEQAIPFCGWRVWAWQIIILTIAWKGEKNWKET